MALDGSHNSDLALKGAGARSHRISSNKQDFDRQVDSIDRWLESVDGGGTDMTGSVRSWGVLVHRAEFPIFML